MANENVGSTKNTSDREESSPLLDKNLGASDEKPSKVIDMETSIAAPQTVAKSDLAGSGASEYGWTANGLPLGHGNVVGEPMSRSQWNSCLFACLGRNDEFCSSDLEVCLLGFVAPCVLYGSNAERLGSTPGTFADHCLPYCGLYLIGNAFCGSNCIARWFAHSSRTAIRRKFNLEGSCEALNRLCGCCGSCVEDELQLERCETVCDFVTHVACHACALCQEGREIRRRLPHPGFNAQHFLVMIPPGEQTMGRGA